MAHQIQARRQYFIILSISASFPHSPRFLHSRRNQKLIIHTLCSLLRSRLMAGFRIQMPLNFDRLMAGLDFSTSVRCLFGATWAPPGFKAHRRTRFYPIAGHGSGSQPLDNGRRQNSTAGGVGSMSWYDALYWYITSVWRMTHIVYQTDQAQ